MTSKPLLPPWVEETSINTFDLFQLKGRQVIVTGGRGLIGQICVETIAELGGHPTILDIKDGFDVSDERGAKYFDTTAVKGEVYGLVNCAIGNQKANKDPLYNLDNDIAVGLLGTAYMCYYFGQQMERNGGGVILNIGSDLSHIAPDHSLYGDNLYKPVSYCAVKAGVLGLTRYFAVLWPHVRCNCLCPGGIDVGQTVPREVKRLMKPYELKGPIALLISDAGSYMNGTIVNVDSGRTIR
jgi:NAD(P)-dependent dehydrogenase (short-subunit alcohol dehydrogenase family)